jgi:hypothetical protein
VDARLHQLQGKAEHVRPAELLGLLQDFYKERAAALVRHESAATAIGDYDANNTYQYVIAREETHLTWIAAAIRDLGGEIHEVAGPAAGDIRSGRPSGQALASEDATRAQQELDRWTSLVQGVSNARQRKMLQVVLGEMREHQRFFEQAAAGRDDLLGRRADDAGQGTVLPSRWLE